MTFSVNKIGESLIFYRKITDIDKEFWKEEMRLNHKASELKEKIEMNIKSGYMWNVKRTMNQECLKQLEKIVDAYMQENGISKKCKNDLINSILLWNGYGSIPWDTKVSQELWDFGVYMEKNYPALSNFFERGIYLFDEQTGTNIDISYMAGLNVAMNQSSNNCWRLLEPEILEDEAAYNGYLEASRRPPSENALEAMNKFLDFYESPDYSGDSRYSDYLKMSDDSRAIYEQSMKRTDLLSAGAEQDMKCCRQ